MTVTSAILGEIHDVVLPNGLRALILENHASPSVVVDGFLHAGSMYEPAPLPGLAAFAADLMERGTEDHDFETLSETLEAIGADVGFGAGRHTLGFDAKCLSEDLPQVLGLTAEMLEQPAFGQDQLEKLRGQVLTGLQLRNDDTRFRAAQRFRQLAYGETHVYGRPAEGTPESVAAITKADIAQFHAGTMRPTGGAVIVVGAVRATEAIDLLAATIGRWQPPPPAGGWPEPRSVADVPPPAALRDHVAMPGKTQSDIVIGHPSLARRHPDWYAASAANSVLGVFGLMGRLGENVRDQRGLAYYAFSRLSGGLGPGPWIAMAGVNPSNVDEAVDAVLFEMDRLCTELVPADELADVKAYLTGSLPLRLETSDGLADAIGDIVLYDLGLDYLDRYAGIIDALTPEIVRSAAAAHLHADRAIAVVAGPPVSSPA